MDDDATHSIIEAFEITYSHQVYFTEGVFSESNDLLARTIQKISSADRPRVFIVADAAFIEANPGVTDRIERYFDQHREGLRYCGLLELPGGEQLKNKPEFLEGLYRLIEEKNLCRHSWIIALGGGALLDLVGFAASTAHRGIRHLRLPTTSLSQGDGGCGVKNGINYLGKKNFIGTFTPPSAVINDVGFLESLPEPRLLDGMIEAIKVALIKDRGFFDFLQGRAAAVLARDFSAIREILECSARYHVLHIARNGDPFELTSSRPLDFGHWSAHKLEVLSGYTLSHGECVAIGIALDCIYSHKSGFLSKEDMERVLKVIQSYGFRIYDERLATGGSGGRSYSILAGLEEFREHMGGQLTIPLLRGIGEQFEVNEIDTGLMESCIEALQAVEGTFQR